MIKVNRFTLYDYQEKAVKESIKFALNKAKKDLLHIVPTGGGKSLVIAAIAESKDLEELNILIITPRIRLLKQNIEYIKEIGVHSGKLGRETFDDSRVLAGTYQTLINSDLKPGLVIVDEAHLIPHSEDSEFKNWLEQLDCKIIGLTASPYRSNKLIFGDENHFDLGVEIKVADLLRKGILVPPKPYSLTVSGGSFDSFGSFDEFSEKALDTIIEGAERLGNRKVCVFVSNIQQADNCTKKLKEKGYKAYSVHSKSEEDDDIQIKEFEENEDLSFLVNVNKLTTGVNIPQIDALAIFRNINSLSLWIQILGRGMRSHIKSGKTECAVFDFGGNITKYGRIDDITLRETNVIYKTCPDCGCVQNHFNKVCDACGIEFSNSSPGSRPESKLKLKSHTDDAELLGCQIEIRSVLEVLEDGYLVERGEVWTRHVEQDARYISYEIINGNLVFKERIL